MGMVEGNVRQGLAVWGEITQLAILFHHLRQTAVEQ
jgi:hypothetical protein